MTELLPQSPRRVRRLLIAVAAIVAVVAVVCLAGASEAKIVFEKMATTLVMPYGLAWMLTSILVVLSILRQDRGFVIGTLTIWCLIYVGGNGYLARTLVRQLESPYVAMEAFEADSFDMVIVLGGGTSVRPDGSVQVGTGGDRVITAARMYHARQAKKILCTGSLIPSLDRFGRAQAEIAAELLVSLGVDPNDVEQIEGRTTAEEMDHLAARFGDETQKTQKVGEASEGSNIGLITSAAHLPRALRLANDRGFFPQPIPSDFRSTPSMSPTIRDLLPSAQAADAISRVAKEWLAKAVGR